MGCDIHTHVERYDPVTEQWVGIKTTGYEAKAQGRDYELFAKLAGVRGNGPEPRGMPDDISPYVRWELESWEADAHSHSWCPLLDFITIGEGTPLPKIKDISTKVYEWFHINLPERYTDKEVDILKLQTGYRVVFWFDN
jgi:hypothetical protein